MAPRPGVWRTLDGMDEQTAILITELQLLDLYAISGAKDGNAPSAESQDAKLAREIYQKDLKQEVKLRHLDTVERPLPEPEPEPTSVVRFECSVCGEFFTADDCYQVPCQHYYCDTCLSDLFQQSTTDETLYPPRCCRQNIPFEDISRYLTPEVRTRFAAKREELDDHNRVYCRVATCSAYIGHEQRVDGTGRCPECGEGVCLTCRTAVHEDECPADPVTQQVLELAQQENWRRCPSCRRMIELNVGCFHMTCLCRTQFCYVCGVLWKNCPCPQWDPARLLARAQVIADREGGRGGGAAQMQAAQDRLVNQHECAHWHWTRVRGRVQGYRCEECGDTLRQFIDQCDRCHTQFCYRCRTNRL